HDQDRGAGRCFTRGEATGGAGSGLRLAEENPAEIGIGVVEPELNVGRQIRRRGKGVLAQALDKSRGADSGQKVRPWRAAGSGPLGEQKEATDPRRFPGGGLEPGGAVFVPFTPGLEEAV